MGTLDYCDRLVNQYSNTKYEQSIGVGMAIHYVDSYKIVHIWNCRPNIAMEVRGIPNLHNIQSTVC